VAFSDKLRWVTPDTSSKSAREKSILEYGVITISLVERVTMFPLENTLADVTTVLSHELSCRLPGTLWPGWTGNWTGERKLRKKVALTEIINRVITTVHIDRNNK